MSYINPRTLLKQKDGKEKLYSLLSDAGYVPQKKPLNEMSKAVFMAMGILLKGQRGGGKTAFPEALAKALNIPLFTLVGLENTQTEYILSEWDRAAQQHFVGQEILNKTPFAEAREKQWTKEFLKLGEVLEGFDYSARTRTPCVILLDEWDKTDPRNDSALLQLLARGYVNVPQLRPDNRIGFSPGFDSAERYLSYPIVAVTSNDERELSEPLKSRLWYCHIPPPTVPETVRILTVAVPEAPPVLLYQTVKLINGINGLPLVEKPALREFILLLQTYIAYGHKFITKDMIADYSGCLVKNYKDMRAYEDGVDLLFHNFVQKNDAELDTLVRQVIQQKKIREKQA